MKNNKLIEIQKNKIKSLEKYINNLNQELETAKKENKKLLDKIDILEDSIAILRAQHDATYKEYMDGIAQMKSMIQKNKQAIYDAKVSKNDYEIKQNSLLKRLKKQA